MANYAVLKAAINAVIKTNGNKEITGQVLNQTLMAIVDSLGENYQFAGVAVPSTNPGTPDQNIFYLATQAGTYTNFGATVLPAGISMLEWKNNTWSSETFFTIDDAPTAGSDHLVKSGGVKTAIDNVAFSTNEKVKDVGIDSTPTSGSDNLIKSGAVFDAFKNDGGAYDVSVHFPTGGVEGGNTYTLDGAIAMVPQNMKKGGMSIKFVSSSDNKYVQARLMAQNFTTDVTQWQGVDDEPMAESKNLVESSGVFNKAVAPSQIITKNIDGSGGGYSVSDGKVVFSSLGAAFKYLKIDDITPFYFFDISNTHSYGNFKTFITDNEDNVLETYEMSEENGYRIFNNQHPASAKKLYITSYNQEPVVKLTGKNLEDNEYITGLDYSTVLGNGFYSISENKPVLNSTSAWKCCCITGLSEIDKVFYNGRVRGGCYQMITDAEDNILWQSQDNTITEVDVTQYPTAAKFYFSNETSQLASPYLAVLKKSLLSNEIKNAGSSLNGLSDVVISSPANGQILKYNSSTGKWYNDNESGGTSTSDDVTIYVSVNGSDSNDGLTYQTPVATVDKALELGASTVLLLSGVYKQQIDLQKAKHNNLTITKAEGATDVVFVGTDSFVTQSETKVEGYTYVYSANYSGDVSELVNRDLYIYNTPEVSTLISASEIHPAQGGNTYRLRDVKLAYTTAVQYVDVNGVYRFTVDIENNKIYFNRPTEINVYHPIYRISRTTGKRTLFLNNDKIRGLNLKVIGINTKFISLNVDNLNCPEVVECSAGYNTAIDSAGTGVITFHGARNAKFTRCEAYGSAGGDGFSGHTNASSNNSTATLIDCWSHDNDDDGISTHAGGLLSIYGGLFEYNGKAGVTPAVSTQCFCYGVLSRKNYAGYFLLNASQDNTPIRGFVCVSCVAQENNRGTLGENVTHCGFIVRNANSHITLIGCKSIGDDTGYKAEADTTMVLVDCSASGNTTIKTGDGTITVNNTSIVS